MTGIISIYSTFGSEEKANEVARALVEAKLVACVNIIPGIKSVYRWKDKVETADEVAMLAKTKKELFAKVQGLIVEMHDYEVPCIVSYDISGSDEKFLGWVMKETTNL